jgi:hypothetical protein
VPALALVVIPPLLSGEEETSCVALSEARTVAFVIAREFVLRWPLEERELRLLLLLGGGMVIESRFPEDGRICIEERFEEDAMTLRGEKYG